MSSSAQADAGEEGSTADAGSSADQHVTGAPETGTFITDQAPTADTPALGSSNEGVNALGANRLDLDEVADGDSASTQ